MKQNKVVIHLYGNDRLDYYDYDSRTHTEGEDGLIDQVKRVIGEGFKVTIEGKPTKEIEEDVFLVIERIEAEQ